MFASLLLLWVPQAGAARITVDATGAGDYSTLQAAVDAATTGDYIAIEVGSYAGASVTSWSGSIIGLGSTPEQVLISDSSALSLSGGVSLRLENMHLSGTSYGIYNNGSVVQGQRLLIQGYSYGLFNDYGTASLSASRTYGTLYSRGGGFDGSHLSMVNSPIYAQYSTALSLDHSVAWGTPVSYCSGSNVYLDYVLYDGTGALPSCVLSTKLYAGFETGWTTFVDDTDPSTDELTLLSTSTAIDAGSSSCADVDGSRCDLGYTGGPLGSDPDSDGDALPDSWEDTYGLSTSAQSGALDLDGDGLDNLGEYLAGTDPRDADSDGDGVEDQLELSRGYDPLDASDQAPTADLFGPERGLVGAWISLDASGSSDPVGQALSYSFSVLKVPSGSAGVGLAVSGAAVSFRPDVAGLWEIQVQVDDGGHQDSASAQVFVREAGAVVRVPQDFESIELAAQALVDGVPLELGEGEFSLNPSWLSGLEGLRIVGAGSGKTKVSVTSTLSLGWLELQDLEMQGQSGSSAVIGGYGPISLYGVHVHGARIAVQGYTQLYVEGSTLEASERAVWGYDSDTIAIARSTLRAPAALFASQGQLRLRGVFIDGGLESQGGHIDADNLTVLGELISWSVGRLSHVIWREGERCQGQAVIQSSLVDSFSGADECVLAGVEVDPVGVDSAGVPKPGTMAWNGGAWNQVDPDGSVRDVGWTGGPYGMLQAPSLPEPWQDLDGDGLSALAEWSLGTVDGLMDSDGDGVGDYIEVAARQDPSEPSDNFPQLSPRPVRIVDQDTLVELNWDDPLGRICTLLWDDGPEGASRVLLVDGAPEERMGFVLQCGSVSSRGELLVLREQRVRVPQDQPTLLEALALAEDHHRIVLEPGVHVVGTQDLRGRHVAIEGQPESWIQGTLLLDGPATSLRDVGVKGDLRVAGGSLTRVQIQGELELESAWLRNVLVVGDARALGAASMANVTVHGDLTGPLYGLRSSVVSGLLQVDPYNTLGSARSVGEEPDSLWVEFDQDPDQALLIPWPGSTLWDAGSQQSALVDLDGSREDIGYTGGPEAAVMDADGDGMPDAWEQHYELQDPELDPDQDGLSNAQEFAAGTNPALWDTDGDRLADGEDPQPRVGSDSALQMQLVVDDAFPEQGQWVRLSVRGLVDPAGLFERVEWSLISPPASSSELELEGDSALLHIDAKGTWLVRVTMWTQDGVSLSKELLIYTREEVLVPLSTNLQRAVDDARPGQVLVLQGGPRELSGLRLSQDIVIRHEEGAQGIINSDLLAPILQISGGARVRVEALTLRAGTEVAALEVREGALLELRQVSVIGGGNSLVVDNASVDAQSSLFSLPDDELLLAFDSQISFVNCALGWSGDEEDAGRLFGLSASEVMLRSSIVQWESVVWVGGCLSEPCSVLADHTLIQDEQLLAIDSAVIGVDVVIGEPGFLRPPDGETNPANADLRLGGGSDAVDAGAPEVLDLDGSPADLGIFGGPWGDWLEVDNDRDGYTNLDGDCDDFDPDVVPNLLTGECERIGGCSSLGRGAGAGWLVLAGVVLLVRRRRGQRSCSCPCW